MAKLLREAERVGLISQRCHAAAMSEWCRPAWLQVCVTAVGATTVANFGGIYKTISSLSISDTCVECEKGKGRKNPPPSTSGIDTTYFSGLVAIPP